MPDSTPAAVRLNFFFNTLTSHAADAQSLPVSRKGLIVPWGPSQKGIRAWRTDWLAGIPDTSESDKSYWYPGKRALQVHATEKKPRYIPTTGNRFDIYIYENQQSEEEKENEVMAEDRIPVMAEYSIPIVTTYQSNGQPERYVQPGSIFDNVPSSCVTPSMCCTFSGTMDLHLSPKAQDNRVLSLTFRNPMNSEYKNGIIRLYAAIYITVPNGSYEKYFFDDPEMEINIP